MKINLPVTNQEIPFPPNQYLVSKTDLKGIITHANDAFVEISGFSRDELIGASHNLVRHPDMPPQAFADLWRTVKSGNPWRGLVKNRSKDGGFYWVEAFVVPVVKNGHTEGYMSVRTPPARDKVQAAEALYQRLRENKNASLPQSAAGFWSRLSVKGRLGAMMAAFVAITAVVTGIGLSGLQEGNASLQEQYQRKLEPTTVVNEVLALLGENRSQIMLALQHDPKSELAKLHDHGLEVHLEKTLANRQQINAQLEALQKLPLSEKERQLVEQLGEARKQFSAEGVNAARDALKAGDFHQASVLLLTKINPIYGQVQQAGKALVDELKASARADFERAQARYENILWAMALATLAALALAVVGGWLLVRAIVNPMRQAIDTFKLIAEGDLTSDIDISRRDEAGQLLCQLATMQATLKAMLDQIQEASRQMDQRCSQLESEVALVAAKSQQQLDDVQSVAAATEEFSQSVQEVAGHAGETASAAQNSERLVEESNTQIGRSMAVTNRVVEAVTG
ncbi:MAG: Tar ligand binding domain-containing protein, partial [Azospira sp.]|nr:Tar ligand binding domain-containing protein [Azospira sp.]